ncbi:MAG: monovalent cation/H+ antiporter subunit D family protein [Paracoccaceae bacterium]|nr:monovalent cation/H+ antiporter subunit D family protein [Paracoccaceae bacterium]
MAAGAAEHVSRTLADHLPILVVLAPFVAAPVAVVIGNRNAARTLAVLATVISLVASWLLLRQVVGGGYISYPIGGWPPPIGIEYRIDAANAFVLLLISAIGTVFLPYAFRSLDHEIPWRNHTLVYCCYLLCLSGLLGIVATGDGFNVFVFLEISSLSTYILVSQGCYRDKRALTAAYDYLIMGTIGAVFFVIGLGMLYMMTGTLNMADLADRIAAQGPNRTLLAAFAFIVVGVSLKVAIFPLHMWLPYAYSHAPSAVTVFLSATATKASIYVLLRFLFSVFQPEFVVATLTPQAVLLPLAIAAMVVMSFVAVFQTDLKRMLAYSSLAHVGYLLLGVALMNVDGLSATIIHLFNHGITKALLFMGAGALVLRVGSTFYDDIAGLGRSMPVMSAAMVIGGLSLVGVPGTAGFVSKWLLVQASFERGWTFAAVLVVASTLLTVVNMWRVFEVLYIRSPNPGSQRQSQPLTSAGGPAGRIADTTGDAPLMMLVPIWILAIACIWFGIDTGLTLGSAQVAAESLLSGSLGMADGAI